MSARIRETFDFNRRQVLSAGLFTALTLVVSPAWGAGPESFIFYGGDILTMEGEAPAYVEALVIQDGLIVFAGSKLEALNRAGAQPAGRGAKTASAIALPSAPRLRDQLARWRSIECRPLVSARV